LRAPIEFCAIATPIDAPTPAVLTPTPSAAEAATIVAAMDAVLVAPRSTPAALVTELLSM
jgi:hypothetical protein